MLARLRDASLYINVLHVFHIAELFQAKKKKIIYFTTAVENAQTDLHSHSQIKSYSTFENESANYSQKNVQMHSICAVHSTQYNC